MKRTKFLVISLISAMTIVGCDGERGDPEPPPQSSRISFSGLEGLSVNGFTAASTGLLASTDDGIYVMSDSGEWNATSAGQFAIQAMEALYPSHILASVVKENGEYALIESLNGGETWQDKPNSFTDTGEKIHALEFDEATGVLYASGSDVVARSFDFGLQWEVIAGDFGGFATGLSALRVDLANSSLWFGGQNAIEQPKLSKLDLVNGSESALADRLESLLPAPSTIKSVRFGFDQGATVYAAGEGGIVVSNTYGETWDGLLVNDSSRFYFDLIVDAQEAQIVTGGWDKTDAPQPLIIELTLDGGVTWTQEQIDDESLYGGVLSLFLLQSGSDRQVLIGTDGGGVYVFR